MSAHVLLNLLNELGKKRYNARLAKHFIFFFAMSLINSVVQEHDCSYHIAPLATEGAM